MHLRSASMGFTARVAGPGGDGDPAVIGPHGALTYGELRRRSESLAGLLARRTSPVLVYGHKEPAVVVAFVAALRAGRAYVPADPSSPPARIERMVDATGATDAVLARPAPPALSGALSARGVEPVHLDPLARDVGARDGLPRAPASDPARTAYVVFTSGTTGDPKGVPVAIGALDHFTAWLTSEVGLRRGEIVLDQAPFTFDLSVMSLYAALLTGGALFSITSDEVADAKVLFARLAGAPITTWVSTPSFARFCTAEPRFGRGMLPCLRRFLFCGETLAPGLARDLLSRFPGVEVWNTYGPTETTVAVTGMRIDEGRATAGAPLPIGRAFAGMDVWIADVADPARELPSGQDGEIVIAGPQLALGYLGAATPTGGFVALPDGRLAYRTGDLGHVDPADGLLYCAGRLDRQVKVHGYRIELEEIEARLRRVAGVRDAAVLAVERDGRPDHLVAFVAADAAASLPAPDLALTRTVRDLLAERLPAYALPRSVRRLETLPLTANGKVDRSALRALL